MEYTRIICHYGEIGLKGKNRPFFEKKLVTNLKKSLEKQGVNFEAVRRMQGRVVVELEEPFDIEKIKAAASRVFGLVYFGVGVEVEQDVESMKEAALAMLKEREFTSFKIDTKRSNKEYPKSSQEVNEEVGAHIVDNMQKSVDLGAPDQALYIEIVETEAFVYPDKWDGPGGLPISTGGKAMVMLSGGIDSPVAGYLTAKRGVRPTYIHFHSYPHTSRDSIDQVESLLGILNNFHFSSKLYLVPFADIQKIILSTVPEKYRVLFYRRFMFRIAEEVAKREGALALVTGESVGQVASQTLENLWVAADTVDIPVLRPLAGMDKQEIVEISKNIGTYKTSIMPCDDTCSWFAPDQPETRANLERVREIEKDLDVDKLVEMGLGNMEVKNI